jgi:hypothetical protein
MEIDLTSVIEPMGFGDVHLDQFFIDQDGCLCQKCTSTSYNVIADSNGNPDSIRVDNVKNTYSVQTKFDLFFKLKRKL